MATLGLRVFAVLLLIAPIVALGQFVNGKADLLAANEAMQKAGCFKNWLRIMRTSGIEGMLARYIQTQPVTIVAPTDAAFAKLPLRIRMQLSGPRLVQLIQFHLILHKLPFKFLQYAKAGGEFRTVFGKSLIKQRASLATTVLLKPKGSSSPTQLATVTRPDILDVNLYLTLAVSGIDNVLIPPNVFS